MTVYGGQLELRFGLSRPRAALPGALEEFAWSTTNNGGLPARDLKPTLLDPTRYFKGPVRAVSRLL